MEISDVIALLGGVAMFLFGMALMGEALKRVAGNRLEVILWRLSNTPLKGVLLGTGVTAVVQSSSATTVMVVGFVNSGMMTVRQAIGIIMGANIGTSVTGWVLCLSMLDGMRHGKRKRPLLANKSDEEMMDFIIRSLKEREPFYSQAKYTLDTSLLENHQQIEESIHQLRKLLNL